MAIIKKAGPAQTKIYDIKLFMPAHDLKVMYCPMH